MSSNKTALHSNRSGSVFAIEDQSLSTGSRFYVHSGTGSSTNSGKSPSKPKATLAQAIALCTAGKGDIIYVMPGHAETTTAVAASVAGIQIVGLGKGRNRPALTATTGASDLLTVSAANVYMRNLRLIGAASGCTALLDINEADFEGVDLVFEHGAAPVAAVTVTGAGERFKLVDPTFRGTAAGPDYCILIEGKVDDWSVVRPRANYGGSSGLDNAFLSSSFKMKGYVIEDPIVIGFDALVIDINSSSAAIGDGVLIGGGSVSSTTQTIANVHDVGGCAIIDHHVTDAVAAKGLVIPTATPD